MAKVTLRAGKRLQKMNWKPGQGRRILTIREDTPAKTRAGRYGTVYTVNGKTYQDI